MIRIQSIIFEDGNDKFEYGRITIRKLESREELKGSGRKKEVWGISRDKYKKLEYSYNE